MQAWTLILIGFIFHAVLFISVFDIYFYAPLVKGVGSYSSAQPAPAKRLVFIVADGLRADKLLELRPDGKSPAPYIRSLVEKEGAWGVSWAAVPTATRPGHVAMTAGFYEDPSSVAKDISGGEILFDTLFNESRYSWSWDTPQFLSKVAYDHKDRIYSEKFPSDHKYLAGIHPAEMDTWVFDEVHSFFGRAKGDNSLKAKLNEDKVLFFLHLGGIDHAGYIVRPNAPEYLTHVTLLDQGIQKAVREIEEFYGNDGQTAFLFTSDHGMTNWGAHGDGSPHEIRCPLVVWGAGIRKAKPETNLNEFQDTISQDWSLEKWRRTDMEQASLAPLMAAMIGIPFPKNAVYPMPTDVFDVSDKQMVHMLLANFQQLSSHYLALEKAIHRGPLAFRFRSFTALTPKIIESIKTDILALLETDSYQHAISMARERIELVLQGIRHYKTYSRPNLLLSTFLSVVGWMFLCLLVFIQQHQNWEDIKENTPLMTNTKHIMIQAACALAVFFFILLYAQSTSVTNCIHFMLPIPIWTLAIVKWYEIGSIVPILRRQKNLLPALGISILCILMTVMSNYYRACLSVCLCILSYWPHYVSTTRFDKRLLIQWTISTLGLAILVGRPFGDRGLNYGLVVFSGLTAILASTFIRWTSDRSLIKGRWFRNFGTRIVNFQIFMMVLATFILYYTSYLTSLDIRTPLLNQALSWTILVVSIIEPVFVSTEIQSRLLTMVFAFVSPFILLSIGQETMYYVFICWHIYLFLEVEKHVTKAEPLVMQASRDNTTRVSKGGSVQNGSHTNGHGYTSGVKHHKHTKSNDIMIFQQVVNEWQNFDFIPTIDHEAQYKKLVTAGDIRRALFLVVMVYVGIFGTGHIASVNSFDVQDVFCFITISNPPRMGVLMVFKLLIPGFLVGAFVRAVNLITFTSTKIFSVLCMFFVTFLCAVFLFFVTDQGSYTHIGETVSHHVLANGVGMFVSLQFGVVYLLTTIKL